MCLLSAMLFAGSQVLYSIDFSKQKDGNAMPWLKSKGFAFLLDSKELNLKFANNRLEFETSGKKAGLFGVHFEKSIPNVEYAIIEWGVERFPKGANWATGNNRVAIGAVFTLGTKKFSSGIPFIKSAPYFFGPFIGQKEKVGKEYLGALYKKSGRYYCIANGAGVQKTRFEIGEKFKSNFGKEMPPLTAFGFQMNTKNTTGGAKAFVKKITFYGSK